MEDAKIVAKNRSSGRHIKIEKPKEEPKEEEKIEINKKGKVRKSRIFYFRKLRGKKAKIKERQL